MVSEMQENFLTKRAHELADRKIGRIEPQEKDLSVGIAEINASDATELKNIERFKETLNIFFKEKLGVEDADFREIVQEIVDEIQKDEPKNLLKKIKSEVILVPGTNKKKEVLRDIKIEFVKNSLKITVSGYSAKEGKNGEIEDFSFDPKTIPGKIGEKGTIDWRKIQKYKSVEKNQKLFTVLFAKKGEEGLNFYGQIISPKEVSDYKLECGSEISKKDFYIDDKIVGYEAFAEKSGVLIINKNSDGDIDFIDVATELIIKGDVSVLEEGNLDESSNGNKKYFPVPVKVLGCVHPGLSLIGEENIIVKESRGGIIESQKQVAVGLALQGTRIKAKEQALVGTANKSFLASEKNVTIVGETIDTEIDSSKVIIKKKENNPINIANLEVAASNIVITNGVFSGESSFEIGEKLFFEQEENLKKLKERKTEFNKIEIEIKEIFANIYKDFLKIKNQLPKGSPDLEIFNEKFPKRFVELAKELKDFKSININDGTKIEKDVNRFLEKLKMKKSLEEMVTLLEKRGNEIEKNISEITFKVSGSLQVGARIEVSFLGKKWIVSSDEYKRCPLSIQLLIDSKTKIPTIIGEKTMKNVKIIEKN